MYQSEHSTAAPSHSRATSSANGACSKIVPIVLTCMMFNGLEHGALHSVEGGYFACLGEEKQEKKKICFFGP